MNRKIIGLCSVVIVGFSLYAMNGRFPFSESVLSVEPQSVGLQGSQDLVDLEDFEESSLVGDSSGLKIEDGGEVGGPDATGKVVQSPYDENNPPPVEVITDPDHFSPKKSQLSPMQKGVVGATIGAGITASVAGITAFALRKSKQRQLITKALSLADLSRSALSAAQQKLLEAAANASLPLAVENMNRSRVGKFFGDMLQRGAIWWSQRNLDSIKKQYRENPSAFETPGMWAALSNLFYGRKGMQDQFMQLISGEMPLPVV